MTDITTEAAPKRLEKRNLGKLATGGVAIVAGAALAATTFGLTQDGSAIFQPSYELPFQAASAETVTITDMKTDGGSALAVRDSAPSWQQGVDTHVTFASELSGTFTIENRSEERAIVDINDIVSASADPTLYDNLHILLVRRYPNGDSGASNELDNEIYRGPLSELAADDPYMGDVDAGKRNADGTEIIPVVQTFDVYLWTDFKDTENENPSVLTADWIVDYDAYGYEKGNENDRLEAEGRREFDNNTGDTQTSKDVPETFGRMPNAPQS